MFSFSLTQSSGEALSIENCCSVFEAAEPSRFLFETGAMKGNPSYPAELLLGSTSLQGEWKQSRESLTTSFQSGRQARRRQDVLHCQVKLQQDAQNLSHVAETRGRQPSTALDGPTAQASPEHRWSQQGALQQASAFTCSARHGDVGQGTASDGPRPQAKHGQDKESRRKENRWLHSVASSAAVRDENPASSVHGRCLRALSRKYLDIFGYLDDFRGNANLPGSG